MTMPSSREVPQQPSTDSPRGVWAVRFPAPGVYAELHGVTSKGRRFAECYASDEDEVLIMTHSLMATLDRIDPIVAPNPRHLAIVRG